MSEQQTESKVIRSFTIRGDLIGLPGQPFLLEIKRLSPEREERTGLGEFRVTFTLGRPGEELTPDKTLLSSDMLRGNSYVRLRDSQAPPTNELPDVKFPVLTGDGLFEIHESVNDAGFLSKIVIRLVKAADFFQAKEIADRLMAPSISWHSTHLDVPLNVYQVDVLDLETDDFVIYRAMKPFEPLVVSQGIRIFDIKQESGSYASIYREALNSNSHIYQFLCFYKIIEGVRNRRQRISAEARAAGSSVTTSSERLPKDLNGLIELLKRLFSVSFLWDEIAVESVFEKQFWGRKVTDIVDKKLRPLRNELGHAFLDSGEIPLSLDESRNAAEVSKHLPMTKCFARWMLKNEFPD